MSRRGYSPGSGDSTSNILDGIRVVSFTSGYAGPYAGRLLAQHGAEVIKVESSRGGLDAFRFYRKSTDVNSGLRFIECNLGVRSFTVDLKKEVGVRLVRELVGRSDAVLVNYRPGVMERLGLGDESLRESSPGLVILKMPGLGETGPRSGYGSWGFNLNAFSGMTYLWNHPGQDRPVGNQGVYPDHLGFILAPTLLLAALLRRRVTGQGATFDLAQVEGVAYVLGVSFLQAALEQGEPRPRGNRDPGCAPQGCYRCRGEDRWCVISVRTDEQWKRLCELMDRPELMGDPRFREEAGRLERADELDGLLQEWTGGRSAEEVVRTLQAAGIPAGIAQNARELLHDPQLRQRGYYEAFADSPMGPFEVPRSALAFRGLGEEPLRLPSLLGEDTESILRDLLGYGEETIAGWREEGLLE